MPVSHLDYYQILGVPSHADGEAIKRAYRSRVGDLHPDRHPQDPTAVERFKVLQEAYAVLGTPERRKAYDGGRVRLTFGEVQVTFEEEGSREELLHSSFNVPAADPRAHLHVRLRVPISFECALQGGRKDLEVPGGEVVRVTVPKGCRNDLTVRVREKGQAGRNGQRGVRGDLFVTFRVEPHSRFRREGSHLHLIERISAVEAMLGVERSITNPYGHTIRITIPPGTQPGERFRIRGQGVVTSAGAGDLFVEVDVEVPKALSEEQRARLRDAAQTLGLL